uniref:Uncharacterized protein n=1 Tax=Romanomermis culicivorax TaxID=13658 RepID=A0A915IC47_ROMCU
MFDDPRNTFDQAIDSNQMNCKDYGYHDCCTKDDMKKKVFSYVLKNFDAAQTPPYTEKSHKLEFFVF